MKEKKYLNNKGFSLIEMLISLAITAIIGVGAFTIVMYGMDRYTKSTKETKLQSEVQFTNNIISDAIKSGEASTSRIEVKKVGDNVSEVYIYTALQVGDDGKPKVIDGSYVVTGQVIYYNAANKSIYIYDAYEDVGSGDDYHLISDKVIDFKAEYVDTEIETTTVLEEGETTSTEETSTEEETTSTGGAGEAYEHESDLISVYIEFDVAGTKRDTLNTYKIRNR